MVFITSTTKTYMERKNTISDMLTKIPRTIENPGKKEEKKDPNFIPSMITPDQDPRRIYLDFTIYTIVLDEEGNYKEVIK